MFRIVRVQGHSMAPDYRSGDYIVLAPKWALSPKVGDDVVFRHPVLDLVIKRISRVCGEYLELEGLNGLSCETTMLGKVSGKDVLGKVIFRIARS
jgi:phage repressor protein C with HTH and peptisase S24 domain